VTDYKSWHSVTSQTEKKNPAGRVRCRREHVVVSGGREYHPGRGNFNCSTNKECVLKMKRLQHNKEGEKRLRLYTLLNGTQVGTGFGKDKSFQEWKEGEYFYNSHARGFPAARTMEDFLQRPNRQWLPILTQEAHLSKN